MLKSIGDESGIEKDSKMQLGSATSLLVSIRKAVLNGFESLGRPRGNRRMEMIETLHLGGKRQLMLVTCDGREYLVGAGGDSVHSIAAMTPQQPLAGESSEVGGDISRMHPGFASSQSQSAVEWNQ